jgi:hypothetical protein
MLSRNSATDRNFITTGHFSAVCSFTRAGQNKSAALTYTFPYSVAKLQGTKRKSNELLFK